MSDADALKRLLLERSIRRGDFVLSSGQRSSYYIDCRLTTMSAEGIVLIGRLALQAIRAAGWRPRAVGGLTMGADPVAYAVAAASAGTGEQVDAFSVRKDAKSHGMGRQIEGNFRAGDEVVVVEDVITTGGSASRPSRPWSPRGASCWVSWRWWTGRRGAGGCWSGRDAGWWR